jgi:bisphosphoglycerate-independent phosphoglycerate mutase (AlkP superfamily)
VFCGDALVGAQIRARGVLADVAPTLLGLLGMDPSAGMDGKSLLG